MWAPLADHVWNPRCSGPLARPLHQGEPSPRPQALLEHELVRGVRREELAAEVEVPRVRVVLRRERDPRVEVGAEARAALVAANTAASATPTKAADALVARLSMLVRCWCAVVALLLRCC